MPVFMGITKGFGAELLRGFGLDDEVIVRSYKVAEMHMSTSTSMVGMKVFL